MPKKKSTAQRRMISLSADLDSRMEKHPEVNWSRVAADAFERKLGELAAMKVSKTMDDVIQRLRASKLEYERGVFAEGIKAGKEWAQKDAEYIELKRLSDFCNSPRYTPEFFTTSETDAFSSGYHLVQVILGVDMPDRREGKAFWAKAIGESDKRWGDDEFVYGFAQGAGGFFDQQIRDNI